MSKPLCADCGEPCSYGCVRCAACNRDHAVRFARALGQRRHRAQHQERAERVERLSLEAARFNHASPDKTEFIRIWVQARSSRGLPHDADDWDAAMAGTP